MDFGSILLMKLQACRELEMNLERALEMAVACETITLTSEDHKEGVAALRGKRDPQFQGR